MLISSDHLGAVVLFFERGASRRPRQTHWLDENSPKTFIVLLISQKDDVMHGDISNESDCCVDATSDRRSFTLN